MYIAQLMLGSRVSGGDAHCKREQFPGLQLRLSKVSELIHNSSNHRNLESAKVSVQFTEVIDLVGTPVPADCA